MKLLPTIPIATVQKIVTEIIPSKDGIAFAKEARDLLIECCVEFITLISSEANEISEKEAKKTIACDHITKALGQLGFSDYVPAVLEAAAEHKEVQKVSSSPQAYTCRLGESLTDTRATRDARKNRTSLPTAV
jgi:histone H3/H4